MNTRFAFDGQAGKVLEKYFPDDVQQASSPTSSYVQQSLETLRPSSSRQPWHRIQDRIPECRSDHTNDAGFDRDFNEAVQGNPNQLVIHPWPDGNEIGVCLSHDIDKQFGHATVDRLATLEESMGFRSSWNFVSSESELDEWLLHDLLDRGHEVCLNGSCLYTGLSETRGTVEDRLHWIGNIPAYCDGHEFRASRVTRNRRWFHDSRFDQAFCFEAEPSDANLGDVGGVWPLIADGHVELPCTLTQEHTLTASLGETTARIWITKLSCLRSLSGLGMLVTRPDYSVDAESLAVYRSFLQHLAMQQDAWHALPGEVAEWWIRRDQLKMSLGDHPSLSGQMANRARVVSLSDFGNPQRLPFAAG